MKKAVPMILSEDNFKQIFAFADRYSRLAKLLYNAVLRKAFPDAWAACEDYHFLATPDTIRFKDLNPAVFPDRQRQRSANKKNQTFMIDLRYLDTLCQAGRKDPDLSIPEASSANGQGAS